MKKEVDTKMWCFLGKFAKRKSLKPDLFRRAVGKAQESPRKARGLSPVEVLVKNVCAEVELAEKQGSLTERMESPSRQAFECEVRDDVLQAHRGPFEECVREALGSLSPESAAESDDDSEWEELKEDVDSICVDTVVSEEKLEEVAEADEEVQHQSTTLQADNDEENMQDRRGVILDRYAIHNSTPAAFTPDLEQNLQREDIENSADMQPEPITSKADEDEANVPEPSILEDIVVSHEDTRGFEISLALPPNNGDSTVEDASTLPAGNSTEEVGSAQSVLHDDLVRKGEAIEVQATSSENTLDEDPIITDATVSANIQEDYGASIDPSEQNEGESMSHAAAALKDGSSPLLVDSISSIEPEELPSPQSQSPKPIVRLPNPTDNSTQDDGVEVQQESRPKIPPVELPARTTRSGARFSDDTNLLKDFLNRAQARKLAKDSKIPAHGPAEISPRRSPRKVLAEVDSNSPSPQKPKDLATRPGTPPGKQRLDAFSFDDVDELTAEPTSCRRSDRNRPPSVSKAAPGAPSFIPVRRANGTDPVVLQKSIAQDLAVQTRANTRRNKGQSQPPSVALQTLTVETTDMAANRVSARDSCKSVGWDEKLVYYQGGQEEAEEERKEEKRAKVRRLRGLGGSNDTPAPKRSVDSGIPQGTPAPRRRGKAG